MKLIKSSFYIKEQDPGIQGIYKQIEWAGRHCYKSLDNITEDSAKPFVDRMINSGHTSTLEHSTIYLRVPNERLIRNYISGTPTLFEKPWCRIYPYVDAENYVYITTNYRHIVGNRLEELLKFLCEPTKYHEKRVTVHFTLPIGISREFCRHRVFSFSEQSTRYCDFSKNKFGRELTFIKDDWTDERLLHEIELNYLSSPLKAQEKRNILPLCTKTELVMTGFICDWRHFFSLRCASNAHPQARELSVPLKEEFIKRGYIDE